LIDAFNTTNNGSPGAPGGALTQGLGRVGARKHAGKSERMAWLSPPSEKDTASEGTVMESPWAPLRRRAFFVLWLAQLGSNIGTWMQTVGAQWFLVEAHSTPIVVAMVQTATMAPALLFSLHAGVMADTFDRRKVIFGMNVLAAVVAAGLTFAAVLGALTPVSLLVFTALIGSGVALSAPAWQAVQPELVPRKEFAAAAALGGVTVNGARAVGPAAAGLLVAWFGPAFVFGLNALSFAAAAAAIYFWRRPVGQPADHERITEALLSGVRYIRSAPHIRRILLRTALFVAPASALWALLPLAANGHLNMGADGYGLLLAALGVGALLGVVVLPKARQRISANAILAATAALFGIATIAAGYLPAPIVAALMVVSGLAWIANLTTFSSSMQLTLSPWVRARGLAAYLLVMQGAQATGALLWGAAATLVGYSAALAASGALLLAVPLSIALWPLPSTTGQLDRTIQRDEEELDDNIEGPEPTSGPVVLITAYRVDHHQVSDFVEAMAPVRLFRLRTGATDWKLTRSVDDPTVFTEIYTVPTWREYVRQGRERTTGQDRKLLTHAWEFIRGEPRTSRHIPY
jgi:MFS family permease